MATEENKKTAIAFVIDEMRKYDPDPEHAVQVTSLALKIFDGLFPLHKYGGGEKFLLQVSCLLHDIGWSQSITGGHHKISRDMINEMEIPAMNILDRFTCAQIARYHTKTLPSQSQHKQFASLEKERREIVEWLAGILRVADALDNNHRGVIKNISCKITQAGITFLLDTAGDCRAEIMRAREKQDLLAIKTGKNIEYTCK